ncbi:MAG: hypothetical protein HLUCCA05_04780 [Roseibaca calidilacus]|uniref:Bacterial PH domain n=1 Tax=Roseibaca calidilacus TaxID=1666912 RepID=A0A0P7YPG6_9RHOB|nr:hypothetical protein [Roseibaca calidilacus]KPP90728.1 MAG: hypothetical protein HLUCCA05_04780 [Roseibaca calidilacus]CUX83459.1 hypothetical protein Ga0058931_2996 [Roseibaca calidilacus]
MTQITLHPGEQLVARVPQDREIAILFEALMASLGLMALTAGFLVFDTVQGNVKEGSSIGTLVTLGFLFGPIAAQRLMRPMPVYWLTDRRLVLDQNTEVALSDIRRIRVWLTGLNLRTDRQSYAINMLANPTAVAALLRDTIAR